MHEDNCTRGSPFLQRTALRNSSACFSSLLIVVWSLSERDLGLSSSHSSLKPIKCSFEMIKTVKQGTQTCWTTQGKTFYNALPTIIHPVSKPINVLRHSKIIASSVAWDLNHISCGLLLQLHFESTRLEEWATEWSSDRLHQKVKKATEIPSKLTFTLSLLKQQNRQFSSNDQSDTDVGSRSMDIKHKQTI